MQNVLDSRPADSSCVSAGTAALNKVGSPKQPPAQQSLQGWHAGFCSQHDSRSAAPQARRLGLGGPRGRGGFGGRVGGSRLLAVSLISGIGRRHVRQVQGEPYQHQQVPPSHHPEHQKYRIHVCRCISRNVFKKGLRTEEWVPKKQQKNKKHPYDYWTRGNGIAEWRTIECPVGHGRA